MVKAVKLLYVNVLQQQKSSNLAINNQNIKQKLHIIII